MKVGMIGLGKLGLPVAYTMAAVGHEVVGYDPKVSGPPEDPSYEDGFAEVIEQAGGRMQFATMEEVVATCEPVFFAVQTPHQPEYEGITPMPEHREDFDYSYLRHAIGDAVRCAEHAKRGSVTFSVISTVLPGTMDREIRPLLSGRINLVYNPSFIAMGTVIRDFRSPEFVLIGRDGAGGAETVGNVYRRVNPYAKLYLTGVREAELAKVAYNTFIGLKLAFANTIGEICHRTDTDVDGVLGALKLADRRLISTAYLDAGMGDGGGCHPRDNIALSWLAQRLNLSYDIFEAAMMQRENHAKWLAQLVSHEAQQRDLPVGILGIAYKPNSHLTTGSPALLVKTILESHGYDVAVHDPHVGQTDPLLEPRVWLVGCRHDARYDLPEGSVVVDPWRYWPDEHGRIEVVKVGAG